MASDDHCDFDPALPPNEVCADCVEEMFYGKSSHTWASLPCPDIFLAERLYQIEHPRLVSLFDEVSPVDEGEFGYWISKAWLKGATSATLPRSSSETSI